MSESPMNRPSASLPAAGWIEWPGRSQIRLTGGDRATFLHNFCTNDIKKLAPGQGCEAFLTSIKGRILGHLHVFAGPDDLMIDTVAGEDVKIRDHLDRYLITEDVQIEVVTDRFRCIYLVGGGWAEILKSEIGVEVVGLGAGDHLADEGLPLMIRRMDLTAGPGYEVLASPEGMEQLTSNFARAAEAERAVPIDAEAFTAYRVDAGFPWYGVDLSEDHLAQEAARTDKAISFTKGCYLGQEPIARIDALGHVNRELRVVAFETDAALAAPVRVLDGTTRADLGPLTSVGRIPGRATVGLGILRTSAQPGTGVVAVTGTGEIEGRVVEAAKAEPG